MLGISSFSQNITLAPKVKMLALGDSYTIGESVAESGRWPVQFAHMLKSSAYIVDEVDIIARTGWTTLDLKKGIKNSLNKEKRYNLVCLLIGVNDQYQGKDISAYGPNFRYLLLKALELAGGDPSKVLVLSIPDYAFTPFGKGNGDISKEIDAYNEINLSISREYKVLYVDITPISREGLERSDLVASDGLHPSEQQYKEWIEKIFREMQIETP